MEDIFAKLEALLSNPEEMESVFVEDVQQTLDNLAARGIEMTREELAELAVGVTEGSLGASTDGELSVEALENVAGGAKLKIGFFNGYRDGMQDSLDGKCGKATKGGVLYKLGYNTAKKITWCI